MALTSDELGGIVRTEQGLMIAGTRITLYDVMDHLAAGWAPGLIHHWLPLTEEQINQALAYIETHRADVEAEYQLVLQESEELKKNWDARNRVHLMHDTQLKHKPEQREIDEKLQAWMKKLGLNE